MDDIGVPKLKLGINLENATDIVLIIAMQSLLIKYYFYNSVVASPFITMQKTGKKNFFKISYKFINFIFYLFIIGTILLLILIRDVHLDKTLNLAVLSPWTKSGVSYNLQATAAILVALEDVYTSGLLPNSYKVNWTWRDTACSNPKAIMELEKLFAEYSGKLHGILGDICSSVCQTVGLLGAAWNVPTVSYLCTLSTLSNKSIYPTFARVGGSAATVIPVTKYFFQYFNWTRIAIVSDTTSVHLLAADSYAALLQSSDNFVYRYTIAAVYTGASVKVANIKPFLQMLNDIRNKARGTILLCNCIIIIHFW